MRAYLAPQNGGLNVLETTCSSTRRRIPAAIRRRRQRLRLRLTAAEKEEKLEDLRKLSPARPSSSEESIDSPEAMEAGRLPLDRYAPHLMYIIFRTIS